MLKSFSLRYLILVTYPVSRVKGDPYVIDHILYDIDARWHEQEGTNERNAYRELLRSILRTNFNVQVYIEDRCEMECDWPPQTPGAVNTLEKSGLPYRVSRGETIEWLIARRAPSHIKSRNHQERSK